MRKGIHGRVVPMTGLTAGSRVWASLDEIRVRSRRVVIARRFLGKPGAVAGFAFLVVLVLLAFAGPRLAMWGWNEPDFTAFTDPPSSHHWFGTTLTGRDVYALTLRGMRMSLIVGLLAGICAAGPAAAGAIAGYAGGWADRVLMWGTKPLFVLPALLIVAIISPAFRGTGWLVLAAFMWMVTAWAARGRTVSLRAGEYVMAARFMGVPDRKIFVRHVLPNLATLLISSTTLNVSVALIGETGLSFWGAGVRPPDTSLGTVIADGMPSVFTFPWMCGFAVALLILMVLSVNLVGAGLRHAFEVAPRGESSSARRGVPSVSHSDRGPGRG